MDQPLSPLETLDPNKLRDMVVDKQSAGTPHQQLNWSQQIANTASPASIDSPHSVVNQRLSTGSADVNSPFQARPSSTQQHVGQSFDFNPRTPMYQPGQPQQSQMPMGNSPTKPMLPQQHMMSPQQIPNHPPASPFQRSSSAASNSCPSPYNQQNQQYPVMHNQMYPQGYGPPMNVRLPPSYPTVQMQQQPYQNYPGTPTWQGQNQQYMVQQQRMMYTGSGYQTGMPPPSPSMTYPRVQRPVNPQLSYPNVNKPMSSTPQPQTPGSINQPNVIGTPPMQQQVPLSPYPNQQQPNPAANPNYHFMQQQRLQQFQAQQQSPIRSPFPGSQQIAPGTPTNTQQGVRYNTTQEGSQTPLTSNPNGQLTPLTSNPNMRSPPLVSPAQAQLPPRPMPQQNAQIQQQHSMEMVVRGMIPNGPSTPIIRPIAPFQNSHQMSQQQPNMINPQAGLMRMSAPVRVPPPYCTQVFQLLQQRQYQTSDVFLAGCVFFFDETVQIHDMSDINARIRYYGGEVETNLNALPHDQRITHLVSENLNSKARQMIKHPVRAVTLNWISESMAKRKVDIPWRASHLPSPWPDSQLPATDKLISSEGFTDSEILCIRALCKRVGAQYTSYFTQKHAALISKSESGQKAVQAEEWKVPVLNFAWLVRLYFGNLQVINEIGKDVHVPPGDVISTVDCGPYSLERITELCFKLLNPWRLPIIVNDDVLNRAITIREQLKSDTAIFPYKRLKQSMPAPTEDQIKEAIEIYNKNGKMPDIRLFFDGMPETISTQLGSKARFLGAQIADSIIECTHYVVPSLKRTTRLCEALARGKDIMDPAWIEHSFRKLHFIDPFDLYARDSEQERRLRFNPLNTIYRARERAVFEDVIFHLGPSVQPSFDVVRGLIEAAGGTVEAEKPSLKKIAEHIRYDKTFLVVINELDAIEYSYLYEKKIPVFNEEFVFMSILRHKIDVSNTFRLNPSISNDSKVAPNPMKLEQKIKVMA